MVRTNIKKRLRNIIKNTRGKNIKKTQKRGSEKKLNSEKNLGTFFGKKVLQKKKIKEVKYF